MMKIGVKIHTMDETNVFVLTAEECSELIQAVCKMQRVLDNDRTCAETVEGAYTNLIEEIADVEICLEKIKHKCCIKQSNIDIVKEQKRERTKQRQAEWEA